MTFEELDKFIHGDKSYDSIKNGTKNGRLTEIENELMAPQKTKYKFKTIGEIDSICKELEKEITQYSVLNEKYMKDKTKVKFKNLYEAVIAVEEFSNDKCPACETPITGKRNVIINPYENAKVKLLELKEISQLEQELDNKMILVSAEKSDFVNSLIDYNSLFDDMGIETRINIPKNLTQLLFTEEQVDQTAILIKEVNKILPDLTTIIEQATRHNEDLDNYLKQRGVLLIEKQKMRQLSEEIQSVKTSESTYEEIIRDEQKKIDDFILSNKELIEEVEKLNI